MSRKTWLIGIAVVIVVAGGAFWGGMAYAGSQKPSFGAAGTAFAGRAGAGGATFTARGGAAGGATLGTIIQAGNGSITIQLPNSTSTTAQTGTEIVLVGTGTQVSEMESVPVSSLAVGDSVTVTGTANSDGSITASSIAVLPAGARRTGANASGSATTQAPMIPAGQ